MRVGHGLIAGSLVLAGAVGSAWSQDPKRIDPGQVTTVAPPAAISDLRVRPTGDIRVSVPVTTIKELSEKECTDVGGDVKDIAIKKCPTGKVCITITSDGTIHANCITE